MPRRRQRPDPADGGAETVEVTARSFETLAAGYPLAWPAPYSRAARDHFEYWWLPPVLSADDQALLARYTTAADDLADSAFLAHPTALEVRVGPDAEDAITAAFPPNENIRGFSVLLRQFHSNGETASFTNAQAALRRANDAAGDGNTERRRVDLSAWGRAAGQLRAWQLKVLVGRRLHREGRFGPGPFPGEEQSPETLLSIYHYGRTSTGAVAAATSPRSGRTHSLPRGRA